MIDHAASDAPPADEAETDAPDLLARARDDYTAGYNRDRENIEEAYADLTFLAGDQWPAEVRKEREAAGRPCQTINRLPQFVRQITGDIRQMRPSIKAVPVDDRGDPDTADVIAGLVRYIENRSDASSVYFGGADSQVQAGIGHWRVVTEYAGDSTLNQEIAIRPVDDGVSVIWDPDAILLDRSDAEFCFVPVDLSPRAFEKRYPGKSATGFGDDNRAFWGDWYGTEHVRVAEYWFKEPVIRTVLVVEDTVKELPDDERAADDARMIVRAAMARGIPARLETRESTRVMRALISGCEILEEPTPWPGRYFPIVPAIGEEVRIGRRVVRFGAIRFARDPQRMYNYFHSAHTETVALQPKAPWIVTEQQVEGYEDQWEQANAQNLPYLTYTPDGRPGANPPSRVQTPVSSQGISDGLKLAADDLQATTGIYNASLGAQSNETSGKAIMARQREGDTGTYVYTERFGKAVGHTGRIVVDLIPHVYDTARTIRIVGLDGKEELVQINQPGGLAEESDEGEAVGRVLNDVTVGAYDVVMEMGPSYNTRREEARDGMTAFLQGAPALAPIILDLIAKNQDWPNHEEIAERIEAVAPPQIKALIAAKKGEPPPPPPPPSPEQQAEAMQAQRQQELDATQHQLEVARLQFEGQKLQAEMAKVQAELQKASIEADTRRHEATATAATAAAQPAPDPRVDELATAVQQISGVLSQIIQALNTPPSLPAPDPGPPPPMMPEPGFGPPDQPQPPPGGFFMGADQPGPSPGGQTVA